MSRSQIRQTSLNFAALAAAVLLCAPILHGQTGSTVDRQRAALKRACASGVLSPDECQQKLAALNNNNASQQGTPPRVQDQAGSQRSGQMGGQTSGAFPTPAGGIDMQEWHDPRNRYAIAIPSGWQVKGDENQLQITKGSTWAVFTTSTNPGQPMDVAHAIAGQMRGQYQRFNVLNEGSFQTRMGHPAAGMTIDTTKNGKPAVILVITQGAGQGHYLSMISYSPGTGGAVNEELNNICGTVRFGNEGQGSN